MADVSHTFPKKENRNLIFFERHKKLGTVNFQRGQLETIICQDSPLVKMSSEKPLAHADLKISGE